jgi:hypothetical protein
MISRRFPDRPAHAERMRRWWEAGECAAMWPVVGLEEVASGEWRVASGEFEEEADSSLRSE